METWKALKFNTRGLNNSAVWDYSIKIEDEKRANLIQETIRFIVV